MLLTQVLLGAVPAPAGGYTFRAERIYHRSLAYFKDSQYERALEGFMDVLLEDPDFPGARDYLGRAARELVKRERRASLQEKDRLMEEIRNMTAPSDELPAGDDIASWKSRMAGVLSGLEDPDKAEKAFAGYAEALAAVPIASRAMQPLANAKADLQKLILKGRPNLSEDPKWKDKPYGTMKTGELAEAAMLEAVNARAWAGSQAGMVERPQESADVERIRSLAASIEALEKAKTALLWTAVRAFNHYKSGRIAESAALWKDVLAADPKNAEAAFYLERSARRMELAAARPAPPKAAAPKPEEVDWLKDVKDPAPPKPAARPPKRPAARPKPAPEEVPAAEHEAEARAPEPAPAARPVDAGPAQDYYVKGLRAYSMGRLDEAIRHWKTCLEIDPSHPRAKRALERALREKK